MKAQPNYIKSVPVHHSNNLPREQNFINRQRKFHKSRTLTFSVDNKKKVQPNTNLNNSLNLPEKKISFFNLNIVLYPYFISKIYYENDKIEKLVNEEIEKVTKNQNKKDNIPFYIVKNH